MSNRNGSPFLARNRIIAWEEPGRAEVVLWLVRRSNQSNMAVRDEILERDLFRIAATRRGVAEPWVPFLERFAREFDWQYAEVWTPGSEHLTQSAWWAPERFPELTPFTQATRSIRFREGEGLPGRVWRSDCSEWLPDVHDASPGTFRRNFAAKSTGLTTFFASPVRLSGRVTHVLVFATGTPREPDRHVMNLTEEAGHGIGQLVADYNPQDTASKDAN